jgi:hypothetical protein
VSSGYELAVQDIATTFDPLHIPPRTKSVDIRDHILEAEAARMLGMTKRALERRRNRGTGPVHHDWFGFTAYYLDDLDAWVASKPKGFTPPDDYGT